MNDLAHNPSPSLLARIRAACTELFRRDRLPVMFLATAAAATLPMLLAPASAGLIYSRNSILHGQLWRLFTGNLVHFGWLHWFMDTGLFLILGRVLEWQYRAVARVSLPLLALCVTGAVFLFDPEMQRYGGLSGMNVGLLVFLACRGWQRDWTDWFWPAVLLAHVVELAIEIRSGGTGGGMIQFSDPTIRVATIAHIGGAFGGLAIWAWVAVRRST